MFLESIFYNVKTYKMLFELKISDKTNVFRINLFKKTNFYNAKTCEVFQVLLSLKMTNDLFGERTIFMDTVCASLKRTRLTCK
jgi:hypothetical protein